MPYRVSASGAGNSYAPVFSGDGRSVAFLSHANNLVTNDDLGPHLDLFVRHLAANNTVLVSVSTNGVGGANDHVSLYALSSNGNAIAFETPASNVVPGDNNRLADIFVRNLTAGATTLVSVKADGTGPGNGRSYNPRISADGRFVVFESLASNLVTNDFNGTNDVFLRDLVAGTTTLVSLNVDGTASPEGSSHSPSISASGQIIAFVSSATNIVAGVTNRVGEVYVQFSAIRETRWASASHVFAARDPITGFYRAFEPSISADGRFVAFKTERGALVRYDLFQPTNRIVQASPAAPQSTCSNYFIFQDNPRLVGPITVSGPAPGGLIGGFGDGAYAFSPDGRFAAFTTGTNAPGLHQTVVRVDFESFVTNVSLFGDGGTVSCAPSPQVISNQVPSLTIVSTNFGVLPHVRPLSLAPVLSDNAQRILFLSQGTNGASQQIQPNDAAFGIFLLDLSTNVPSLVSTNRSGASGNVVSDTSPALTADGRFMAWESADPDLVADDLNGAFDVFVRDLMTGETTLISAVHPALPSATGLGLASTGPGSFSADGTRLAIASLDGFLNQDDTNVWRDGFVREMRASATFFVSGPRFPSVTSTSSLTNQYLATNQASVPLLSADGRYALFDGMKTFDLFSTNHSLIWRDLVGGTNVIVAQHSTASRFALSPAGRLVVFHSALSANQQGAFNVSDGNNVSDIFAWNPSASGRDPRMHVLSASSSFVTGNAASENPVLSPDGCWLAFVSLATNLTADSAGSTAFQVFVRSGLCHPTNSFLGTNRLISYRTFAPNPFIGQSIDQPWPTGGTNPVFSADSRYVFFKDGVSNVLYRHDLLAADLVTLDEWPPGVISTNIARITNLTVCTGCLNPSPSADGQLVAYEVPGTNGLTNIILRDFVSGATELISANLAGTGGGKGPSFTPLLSYDGRYVVFSSKAADLVVNDTNRAEDIFVRDRRAGVTHCLSRSRFGTATGNRVSSRPVVSADGRSVAFQSFASDLVAGDYNDTRDVFVITLQGLDTDGDELDDDWEMAYFDDLSRNGAGDFDGDGASDAHEFRAGTDPTNNGSVLRVLTLTRGIAFRQGGGGLERTTTLLWAATPGRRYRVQMKPDDLSTSWVDLPGDVMATSTSATKTHTTPINDAALSFYRVQLVP